MPIAKYTQAKCIKAFKKLIRRYKNAPYKTVVKCPLCVLSRKYEDDIACLQCPYTILFPDGYSECSKFLFLSSLVYCYYVDESKPLIPLRLCKNNWREECDRPIAERRIEFLRKCIEKVKEHPELFIKE